jgi:hypothetical protein
MKLNDFFLNMLMNKVVRNFLKIKEAKGIAFRQCGSLCHYWIEKENRWRCKNCRQPLGLKAGKVMEIPT